ncbi:phosphatidate phosphatase LPIN2 isoform X2 [Schistocerca nitens]|uniref:phosphatidate phosphatase LPIN2 isoform X2 n=1 Tax=Schistocerca nitens TaxID=7011 RepID=UPI0021198F58|nr:phosphatidate phosphatase LPIN2 isoform X2 [Schistocerca nitens]
MYSMHAIGKFISNFRDFYNEINAATLTGAIDVVVVEQPDGNFTCSPFHVRFGKLGVLRSREKVVDIEINGEPQDIHMKLGESGEAFFVEEVPSGNGSDEYIPPHLACSPIPQDFFPPHFASRELHDEETAAEADTDVHHSSDSIHDETTFVMDDVSSHPDDDQKDNTRSFESATGKEVTESQLPDSASLIQPKTFCAETLNESSDSAEKVRKISIVQGEFRPISVDGDFELDESRDTGAQHDSVAVASQSLSGRKDSHKENSAPSEDSLKPVNSNNRRKKRRKSLKKKAGQKKTNGGGGSSSQTDHSELSEGRDAKDQDDVAEQSCHDEQAEPPVTCSHLGGVIVDSDVTTVYCSECDTCRKSQLKPTITVSSPDPHTSVSDAQPDSVLVAAASNLAELSRIQHASTETDFHFFSDTELTPGCRREIPSCRITSALSETAFEVLTSVLSHFPQDSRPSSPVQSDTEYEVNRQSKGVSTEGCLSQDEHGVMQQSWRWGELPSPPARSLSTQSPRVMTKEKPDLEPVSSSDEDVQKQQQAEAAQRSMLSGMFSFMKKTKRIRHNPESEGIYLSDLNMDELDPEVAALYFPTSYRQGPSTAAPQHLQEEPQERQREDDAESGNGTSLPQSPNSVEGAVCGPKSLDSDFDELKHSVFEKKSYGEISLSLCGGLSDGRKGPSEDAFLQNIIAYDDIVRDPKIIESPNLVVRFNGKFYNWKTACPIVMSLVVYQKPLPQEVIDTLCAEYMTSKKDSKQSTYSSWFYWRRASQSQKRDEAPSQEQELSSPEAERLSDVKEDASVTSGEMPEQLKDTSRLKQKSLSEEEDMAKETEKQELPKSETKDIKTDEIECLQEATFQELETMTAAQKESKEEGYSGSNSSDESDGGQTKQQIVKKPLEKRSYYDHPEKYRKTLRLSSDQIAKLNLQEGANEVVFSVTTAYQGTTRCKCHIYRWRYDDKIVISDIDGTITKSDVLGHILPIVGKDWAQSGVAQLFTKIKNNGYKLLYLSARAIGQARVTREYLKSIKQGNLSLPEGPLLLNPTSLISAFHREVIEKKPEEFKISCLRDIQALFPENSKPFYAGYGNRINDVWAYRAVGIPIFRIFTINHRGELKHELTQTFQSSYSNMSYIVDQMFPPPPEDTAEDFSNFVYWRDPIAEIELDPSLVSGHSAISANEAGHKKAAGTA